MRNKRPLSVTILGAVYLAVGAAGFVGHFRELWKQAASHYDGVLVEVTELTAILCGVYMLRGKNWARWTALGWMIFHVILSAFRAWSEFAIHCLFALIIAFILFRPPAAQYFRTRADDGV